jgi:hemerythrin superfamily protein
MARSEPTESGGQTRAESTDAISLLAEQHRQVLELFDDYESYGREAGATSERKMKLFNAIADALAAHSEIEERIFYPTVMADRTAEELRQAVEEHLEVKRLIADLLVLKPDHEQFDSKVRAMRKLFELHRQEEESTLFDAVRELDAEALHALGEMMKTAFDNMMKEEPRKKVPSETSAAPPLS